MKKKTAQSKVSAKPLPELEVLAPYTKTVFGKPQTTNQFPIGIPQNQGGVISHSCPATVTGKDMAETLCLGIEALKLVQKLACVSSVCKSVANHNVKLKAEMHRIVDKIAELGYAHPDAEIQVRNQDRDIKVD